MSGAWPTRQPAPCSTSIDRPTLLSPPNLSIRARPARSRSVDAPHEHVRFGGVWMRYLALIYNEEVDPSTIQPDAMQAMMAAYNQFGEAATKDGVLEGGAALQPTMMATTVRVRDGQRLSTAGPFAETKAALAGHYRLNCKELDQAIEWAARIPGASSGSVEVRPLVEFTEDELSLGTDPSV